MSSGEEYLKYTGSTYGVSVECDHDMVEVLVGRQVSSEDAENIVSVLVRDQKEAWCDVPSLGLVMNFYDWSTDCDFGDHIGGGHTIGFGVDGECDSMGLDISRLFVNIEWDDTYIGEQGLSKERSDEVQCFRIGLEALNDFLESL